MTRTVAFLVGGFGGAVLMLLIIIASGNTATMLAPIFGFVVGGAIAARFYQPPKK